MMIKSRHYESVGFTRSEQKRRRWNMPHLEPLEARSLLATIVDLGQLSGTFSNVTGVNSTAEVVGQTLNQSSDTYQAFLIDSQGVQHDVGPLPGYTYSYANGLNDAAQVVGYSQNPAGGINTPLEAFLYSQGTLTDLKPLGGSVSVATSINASGNVVGYSTTSSSYLQQDAVLWSQGGAPQTPGGAGGRRQQRGPWHQRVG